MAGTQRSFLEAQADLEQEKVGPTANVDERTAWLEDEIDATKDMATREAIPEDSQFLPPGDDEMDRKDTTHAT